ncbi:MAG TPA: glutamine synthetase family protein [Nocardioidaceae bacterium]|nr:glutamine synthetase family protein [Nocardioidaceae bacterium]
MEGSQADIIIGSIVDMAGVARAKVVGSRGSKVFAQSGMGASPSWNVFCVDDQLAFTPNFSVVGDLRLRIDEDDLRVLEPGVFWAPARICHQSGEPAACCPRTTLDRAVDDLRSAGLEARVGHEIEFTLVPKDGGQPTPWAAYGLGSARRYGPFMAALLDAADRTALDIEQIHAEYGPGQFEISLGPEAPTTAADNLVLARMLISSVAREHGAEASFSPMPFVGGSGNGAHLHLSLLRSGRPLFSGGEGPHGMTDEGGAAIAGVLRFLPDALGVLACSAASHLRLRPDTWSGAYCCWGLENREAAVRFCADTRGNPHGANIEVKPIDASANPYLSTAVILGIALAGIRLELPLPSEATINPALLTADERGRLEIEKLSSNAFVTLERLERSDVLKQILGEDITEAVLAVRRREYTTFKRSEDEEVAEQLRFVWTL